MSGPNLIIDVSELFSVTDPEVMRELVEHDASDLAA